MKSFLEYVIISTTSHHLQVGPKYIITVTHVTKLTYAYAFPNTYFELTCLNGLLTSSK